MTDRSTAGEAETDEAAVLLALLDELCAAHSPAGDEGEMDAILRRRLAELADRVWQDPAGNVIAHIAGERSEQPLLLNAHKDEIALVVKQVEDDGRMRVQPIGGAHPWKYGEGPVDLLADGGSIVPAALCFGATHISEATPLHRVKSGQQGFL
jgi:putative aminopeptidase FrvX